MNITKNVTRRIEKLEKDFEEIKNLLIKIEGTTWWNNVDKKEIDFLKINNVKVGFVLNRWYEIFSERSNIYSLLCIQLNNKEREKILKET